MVWVNSPLSDSYDSLWDTVFAINLGDWSISLDLRHWIDEGLMALFFFVIGLEVRRELSVGELTDRHRVTIPVIAGIGGMLLPALLYALLNHGTDAGHGWGIVIATDTAFLLGALAIVGPHLSTQLRIFLLTLAIVDDIVAISVIGIFYSESLNFVALGIAVALPGDVPGPAAAQDLPGMGLRAPRLRPVARGIRIRAPPDARRHAGRSPGDRLPAEPQEGRGGRRRPHAPSASRRCPKWRVRPNAASTRRCHPTNGSRPRSTRSPVI